MIRDIDRQAREDQMTSTMEQISDLLHEASGTHHRVFRIVDGADDDWASWYAQWLIDLSSCRTCWVPNRSAAN